MTAAEPALAGHFEIEAGPDSAGGTRIVRQSVCAPFHLGKPYREGRVLQVRLVNATAGILAGDRLELSVRVRRGAALLLTTPSATRAFMMRSGACARCRQAFAVEAGSWLEYAPEPLFPHRESDYAQHTRLEAEEGAEAYHVEAVAPGRAGRGEAWAWRSLRLELEVLLGGEPVLIERWAASGAEAAEQASLFGARPAWFATAVALSPRLDGQADILEAVRALHGAGQWVGITRLRRGGWVIRVVAPGGLELRDTLGALRGILAEALPLLRSDLRRV